MKNNILKKIIVNTSLFLMVVFVSNTIIVFGGTKPYLSKTNLSMRVGVTKTISLKKTKKKVKWSIKNKSILSVKVVKSKYMNKIKVKGLKKGKTTVTAKYKGKKYSVKITVLDKKTKMKTPSGVKDSIDTATSEDTGNVFMSTKLLTPNHLEVSFVNNTNCDIRIYKYDCHVEKFDDNKWVNITNNTITDYESHTIGKNSCYVYTVAIGEINSINWVGLRFDRELTNGLYRLVHRYYIDENVYKESSSEFNIVEHEGTIDDNVLAEHENEIWLTAEVVNENNIAVSVYNGKENEVTYAYDYVIEKKDGDDWVAVPGTYYGIERLFNVPGKTRDIYYISIGNGQYNFGSTGIIVENGFEPGIYRIKQRIIDSSNTDYYYAVFTIK